MQRCANSYSGDYREDRVRLPRSGWLLGGLSGALLGGLSRVVPDCGALLGGLSRGPRGSEILFGLPKRFA